MAMRKLLVVVVIIGVCGAMSAATWHEDSGCTEGCEEEAANNKFALLFQQMLARQRETDTDCQLIEDCPEGFECLGGKCRSAGPRRTKMINLYSRW